MLVPAGLVRAAVACGGVQAVQRGVCGPGVEGGDGAAASGGGGAAAQLPAAQAAHPGQPGAVREAGQRGPVLQLLLPAGQLPAVPGRPRAQAPVLALPQAARRLVPGARLTLPDPTLPCRGRALWSQH